MKIALWNTEWASPGSERERLIRKIVKSESPDVICITEGYIQSWEDDGEIIYSEADYGYAQIVGRRKVILWSKSEWKFKDDIGNPSLPSGRFVSGVTGGFRFIGSCIPWKDAHVKTGRKDRSQWEDHQAYIEGISDILDSRENDPAILLGDFNQRIPRLYSPIPVYEKLMATLGKRFWIATEGALAPINELSIDHICFSHKPHSFKVRTIDRIHSGVRLSDHFGLIAEFDYQK
jgi:exonuclease III